MANKRFKHESVFSGASWHEQDANIILYCLKSIGLIRQTAALETLEKCLARGVPRSLNKVAGKPN